MSGTCFFCGREPDELGLERVYPRAGDSVLTPTVKSCRWCRARKNTMPLEAYRFYVGLHAGTLPWRFALEPEPAMRRDILVIPSKKFILSLVEHNSGWTHPAHRSPAQ